MELFLHIPRKNMDPKYLVNIIVVVVVVIVTITVVVVVIIVVVVAIFVVIYYIINPSPAEPGYTLPLQTV